MHYVIGDVHGCFKELKLLLNKIESNDPNAIIYFVGDWVDRGDQVADVMQWVVENISTTGKYQSVRGNHDQEALDWYNDCFVPWTREKHNLREPLPETHYDFAAVVDNYFNRNPDALRPFFDKVKSAMPYNMAIEVTTAGGVDVTYRICHAWHAKSDEASLIDINLYERSYWGYYVDDEIIVHGHTPTVTESYRIRGTWDEDRPGMIGYRNNDINIDGGCCFHKGFPQYACMLCGICLETLEEIYPYSLEERLLEGAMHQAENMRGSMYEISFEERVNVIYENNLKEYMSKKSNRYREKMLERLGLNIK